MRPSLGLCNVAPGPVKRAWGDRAQVSMKEGFLTECGECAVAEMEIPTARCVPAAAGCADTVQHTLLATLEALSGSAIQPITCFHK